MFWGTLAPVRGVKRPCAALGVCEMFRLIAARCGLPWIGLLWLMLAGVTTAAEAPLRLGIMSLASPARIHAQWQEFAAYLSEGLGREVKIVVPKGFMRIHAAIQAGEVDVFYTNSNIYYHLKNEGIAEPLAQMENLLGSIYSTSVIFVSDKSAISQLGQLKGEKIAFISPMGAGGYVAPKALLRKAGLNTAKEAEEVFTRNLASAIHKVLLDDVKAGVMCGLSFELMSKKMDTGELRVIGESEVYPENVLAANRRLDDGVKEKIRRLVVGMEHHARGRQVLASMSDMKVRRFLAYDEKVEGITTRLLETIK